jgi:hypothetical protein
MSHTYQSGCFLADDVGFNAGGHHKCDRGAIGYRVAVVIENHPCSDGYLVTDIELRGWLWFGGPGCFWYGSLREIQLQGDYLIGIGEQGFIQIVVHPRNGDR